MKKVSPLMLSFGLGSALAWLILNPQNRQVIKKAIKPFKTRSRADDDGMYYI